MYIHLYFGMFQVHVASVGEVSILLLVKFLNHRQRSRSRYLHFFLSYYLLLHIIQMYLISLSSSTCRYQSNACRYQYIFFFSHFILSTYCSNVSALFLLFYLQVFVQCLRVEEDRELKYVIKMISTIEIQILCSMNVLLCKCFVILIM